MKILNQITFKTKMFRKNYDILTNGDNIITECDGIISKIRINENKSSLAIGEYGISIWNLEIARKLKIDINELIKSHELISSYDELLLLIKNSKDFNLSKYNKLVIAHNLVIRKDYRKKGITTEFAEMLYRDFYNDNTLILAYVKPFQNVPMDNDYYLKRKTFIENDEQVSALKYYSLNEFLEKEDSEKNEYKLFSLACKSGFTRLNDTYLFKLLSDTIFNNLKAKQFNENLQFK